MTTSCLPRAFRFLANAVLALTALGLRAASPATFDIPAQPAPAALKQFIKQSGTQVVYIQDDLKAVTTKAVKGELSPADALAQLLDGTGFTVEPMANGNFTISRQVAVKPGSIEGTIRENESSRPVAGARVAIAGTDFSVVTDKRGRFIFAEAPTGEHTLEIIADGIQNTKVTDVSVKAGHRLTLSSIGVPVKSAGAVELEPYVVSAKKNDEIVELDPYKVLALRERPFSGSSIDLQRTANDALPFTTFSYLDIQGSPATNVEEFLRSRLSQNFSTFIPDEQLGSLEDPKLGINQLDFRGWGSGEQVILVNGRRLPPQRIGIGDDSIGATGDFRSIPLNTIERIEVLSSAGSAIYGEGATGGVINIITRRNWSGGMVAAAMESPVDGKASKRTFDLFYAKGIGKDTQLSVTASYSERSPLHLEDRADVTVNRLRSILSARAPDLLLGNQFSSPPLGGTTNIKSSSGTPLFGPNTPSYTSVPDGYAGGGGLAPFLGRQGVLNLDLAEGVGNALSPAASKRALLGTYDQTTAFSVALDQKLGTSTDASIEYRRLSTRSEGAGSGTNFSFTVPSSVAVNPFQQTVRVNLSDVRFERPELTRELTTTTNQLTGTLRFKRGDWQGLLDSSLTWNENSYHRNYFEGPLLGGNVITIRSAVIAGLYNPFVDTRSVAPASTQFYEEYGQTRWREESASRNYQVSAKVSGPIAELPAGRIQVTGGLEWLREDRHKADREAPTVNSKTGQILLQGLGGSRSWLFLSDTMSCYSEVTVPLIAPKQSMPLISAFEVFSSGRVSALRRHSYSANDGSPITYETEPYIFALGARYQPLSGLIVRATRSIGFKPPTLDDITPSLPQSFAFDYPILDRRRGDESYLLPQGTWVSGGNPDLLPETTTSNNYGIVLAPTGMGELRVSVDYVDSVRSNAIVSLSPQTVLDLESSSPAMASRVQRATPESNAPNGVGLVTFVDSKSANFSEIRSRSVDIMAEHRWNSVWGGRLIVNLAATKNISFKLQASPNAIAVEQVRNRTAALSRQLKWNGNAGIRWEKRQWTLGWSTRYFDSVLVPTAYFSAQGGDRTGDAFVHDVVIRYQFPKVGENHPASWLLSELSVTLSVKNVLDSEPRFLASTLLGYVPSDSLYGRTAYIQIRKNF